MMEESKNEQDQTETSPGAEATVINDKNEIEKDEVTQTETKIHII